MGIRGNEILRAGVQIGEIAAAAARDQNFLADAIRVFEDQDASSARAGFDGTHQPGRTGSQNDGVVSLIHAGTSLTGPCGSGVSSDIYKRLKLWAALVGSKSAGWCRAWDSAPLCIALPANWI